MGRDLKIIVSKAEFERFQRLQDLGTVNMVSSRVQELLRISKEKHKFIMENYELLEEIYE